MKETFVLFKDLEGYYFLTNERNFNAGNINNRTILKLITKEKNKAIEIFENNFKGCNLIIK